MNNIKLIIAHLEENKMGGSLFTKQDVIGILQSVTFDEIATPKNNEKWGREFIEGIIEMIQNTHDMIENLNEDDVNAGLEMSGNEVFLSDATINTREIENDLNTVMSELTQYNNEINPKNNEK